MYAHHQCVYHQCARAAITSLSANARAAAAFSLVPIWYSANRPHGLAANVSYVHQMYGLYRHGNAKHVPEEDSGLRANNWIDEDGLGVVGAKLDS